MQENTNKSIAVNSLILYIRLAIISVSGLLYTRFSLQALGISGLYPCGEGAGYAGGITSAAVDGIKVYEAIVTNV
jgi:uncharacterized FAD-dependent dehydrogenase